MMICRGVFLFLVIAIARSPSSDDRLNNTFARAWVVGPSNNNKNQNPLVSRVACKLPALSAPSTTTWLRSNNKKNAGGNSCLHSSVESPRRVDARGSIDDDDYNDYDCDYEFDGENQEEVLQRQQEKLSQLYNLLQAEPKDLIRFEDEGSSGVRGMYLNHSVKNGEIILKLPLSSCLTDDRPPSWLHDEVKNDPHRWATRLAASWADLHLKNKLAAGGKSSDNDDNNNNDNSQQVDEGHAVWSSLLPDPEYLRASLPVHWPETTVLNARSTALELAVDSAFFARAEAVDDLVCGFLRSPYADLFSSDDSKDGIDIDMTELAHRALDLIQTRSCRLEETRVLDDDDDDTENGVDQEYRRVLAPIFDFINHGSRNVATGSANAYFALEEDESSSSSSSSNTEKYLVVRSMKDISQEEEVKMDYGASARPAWKCLLSYGFVPEYKRTTNDADGVDNLAEVYMNGVRYEVADDTVPIDMVADATPLQWAEEDGVEPTNDNNNATPPEIVLTPDIALRIASRIADAAFYLLLEPEQILDDVDNKEDDESNMIPPTPFEVISKQLAASLRWSQHRILLTSAAGLTQFAKEHTKEEESTCHP